MAFSFCRRKNIFLKIIQKEFFFGCHKLLKNNPINTKVDEDLFIVFFPFVKTMAIWRQKGLNHAI